MILTSYSKAVVVCAHDANSSLNQPEYTDPRPAKPFHFCIEYFIYSFGRFTGKKIMSLTSNPSFSPTNQNSNSVIKKRGLIEKQKRIKTKS